MGIRLLHAECWYTIQLSPPYVCSIPSSSYKRLTPQQWMLCSTVLSTETGGFCLCTWTFSTSMPSYYLPHPFISIITVSMAVSHHSISDLHCRNFPLQVHTPYPNGCDNDCILLLQLHEWALTLWYHITLLPFWSTAHCWIPYQSPLLHLWPWWRSPIGSMHFI